MSDAGDFSDFDIKKDVPRGLSKKEEYLILKNIYEDGYTIKRSCRYSRLLIRGMQKEGAKGKRKKLNKNSSDNL